MLVGIFFAVVSPAIYALVNYIDKFLLEKFEIPSLILAVYSGTIAFLVSILLIFIIGLHAFAPPIIISIILSGFFTELCLLPYFKALSLDETSSVIPLFQFVPVFVIIGDALILGESLTYLQYVGSALIIISGLLLSIQKNKKNLFRPRKALWFMLLSCVFAAFSILFFKFGVTVQNFWQILPYEGFGIALCAVCLLFLPNNFRLLKKQTKRLPRQAFFLMSIDEAVYILSRYTGFFALSLISASLVSVLAGLQPLFVLIYGIILSLFFPYILKEVIAKKTLTLKLISIIMIVFGAILLAV